MSLRQDMTRLESDLLGILHEIEMCPYFQVVYA